MCPLTNSQNTHTHLLAITLEDKGVMIAINIVP